MTLARIGHAPGSANETAWHNALANAFAAAELSRKATASRLANGTHSVCGHRYANAQCKTQCAHVGGHCGNCD